MTVSPTATAAASAPTGTSPPPPPLSAGAAALVAVSHSTTVPSGWLIVVRVVLWAAAAGPYFWARYETIVLKDP